MIGRSVRGVFLLGCFFRVSPPDIPEMIGRSVRRVFLLGCFFRVSPPDILRVTPNGFLDP